MKPWLIGLLQTTGFLGYVALVAAIMLNGARWFGTPNTILGPMLFMSLFVFSAITCASIFLAYPFYLFWEKKNLKKAISVIASSVIWLFVFILAACLLLVTGR